MMMMKISKECQIHEEVEKVDHLDVISVFFFSFVNKWGDDFGGTPLVLFLV